MSWLDDTLGDLLEFIGLSGGDTIITTTADARTDVVVSPEITSITIFDTQPLADVFEAALDEFRDIREEEAGAARNAEVDKADNFRLLLSLGGLGLALARSEA